MSSSVSTMVLGLLCAVGSAIFNGSFAALFKTQKMTALSIHPMVFQLYVCSGVFLSSWLVVPFLSFNPKLFHPTSSVMTSLVELPQTQESFLGPEYEGHDQAATIGSHFRLSPMGMLAGCLLVLGVSASFQAIEMIGIALAQGIWGGGAMVVSYLWGVVVFGEVPRQQGLSLVGLFLLVMGVLAIAFCRSIARKLLVLERRLRTRLFSAYIGEDMETTALLGEDEVASLGENEIIHGEGNAGDRAESFRFAKGVLWACSVGLFGGSILAPMHYVPPEEQGLVFLPSFGIGAMLLSPLVFCLHTWFSGAVSAPPLHLKEALATGLLSGTVWNIGNVLSMIAIPAISYGVAYSVMQCAILMSGIWGIYFFGEISEHRTIRVFWCGGIVLLIGGALLAIAQES